MTHTKKLAIGLVSLAFLGGCEGVGGLDNSFGSGGVAYPVQFIDEKTIEENIGAVDGQNLGMDFATSTAGGSTEGVFRVTYGQGNTIPSGMAASFNTNLGALTTPHVQNNSRDTLIMDGQVVRAQSSAGDVFYLPSSGSSVRVGMVRRTTGEVAGVGVFGKKTTAAEMAPRIVAGGSATYTGPVDMAIDNRSVTTVHEGYEGTLNATVSFTSKDMTYNSTLAPAAELAGSGTIALSGSANFDDSGAITGTYDLNSERFGQRAGATRGAFYGNNANSIGMVFEGSGVAGGAIMKEDATR